MKYKHMLLRGVFSLLITGTMIPLQVAAQTDPNINIALARQYVQEKAYDKAIPVFKKIYEQAPFDKGVYDEYLDALLLAGEYTAAEELVQYMTRIRREDPVIIMDLGRVWEAAGKKKKALEQFDLALSKVSGEDFRTRQLADAFARNGQREYAVKTYERARTMMQNPYLYATELALLYGKGGNTEAAANALMDVLILQPHVLEDIKSSLLQLVEGDEKKLALLQKLIVKRVSAQPDNPFWIELLTWVYTQKGDYEGAFQQITALDKKLKEEGQRVIQFSRASFKDGHLHIALKGYDYVLAKGTASPMNEEAREGKIEVLQARLAQTRPVDPKQLNVLLQEYESFFAEYPQYRSAPLIRNYAMVQARYAHNIDTAIIVLQEALRAPNMKKDVAGYCKLDLGDYHLLKGKIWDASLLYAQVDKAFKEDMLGEEARFRNAKLAYYNGDFKWAQGQLSVLKASTTELIANDALYLSVLITENSPVDSNLTPLLRFAAADLLLFQNKTRESDALLDSIATHFPDNELMDDICLLRAKIAEEEGRNDDAIKMLNKILEHYADDVLGDDAAFRLAQLYDDRLKDKSKALQYYELLITQYPGSTYIQTARARYQQLSAAGINPSS
jgi:tetratricopeptide (TPR) repeat protein